MVRSFAWVLVACAAWASAESHLPLDTRSLKHAPLHIRSSESLARRQSYNDTGLPQLLAEATPQDLQRARTLVAQVNAVQAKCKEVTTARNTYALRPDNSLAARSVRLPRQNFNTAISNSSTPNPTISSATQDEIAYALALVAEADAVAERGNNTFAEPLQKRAAPFWFSEVKHQGSWPFGDNPSDFTVYRNVKGFGAKGDGVTDDRKAIQDAIKAGAMCGAGCYSTSTKMAVIYFPPGTYLVSGTIETYYGTQLIGDPNDRPVMVAGRNMGKMGIFSTNKYVGDGTCGHDGLDKEWYINTANFYRAIRNFIFDSTKVLPSANISVMHWQVAQAASLQNVEFRAQRGQKCIFAENGSGGQMSDIVFKNCEYGIYGGNQQFTAMRLKFENCRTAIRTIWDWGWTWKSINIDGSDTAFQLVSEDGVYRVGSVSIVDSAITNTNTALMTHHISQRAGDGTTSIILNNVKLRGVPMLLVQSGGGSDPVPKTTQDYPIPGGSKDIDTWVLGRLYDGAKKTGKLQDEYTSTRDPKLVDSNNPLGLPLQPYFERKRPQYEGASRGDFLHARDYCKGDGVSDDTACFQELLMAAVHANMIVFVDAGTYIFTDTVTIPPGSRLVGEAWSQLAAFGPRFGNSRKPVPLVRVGQKGDVGTVEMQDLIFTSKGPTPGVTFLEWNIEASAPGAAGMWDVHVRVGGAAGTSLEASDCPALKSGTNGPHCNAGAMLMHLTDSASAYIENSWLWIADHDLDDKDLKDDNNFMTQLSIYVARGFLIESKKPTWIYSSSSEHAVLYQYQFHRAENIVAGMLQTEQAYFQPTPNPPAPFGNDLGVFKNDPMFRCTDLEPCDAGWALRIVDSKDVTILGAGFYSWFDTYDQTCVGTINCQKVMAELVGNRGGISLQNIITIGSVNMLNADGTLITAQDNAVDSYPHWAIITTLNAGILSDVFLPPELVCNTGPPSSRTASCQPPCRFILSECNLAGGPTTITVTTAITAEVYIAPSSTSETTITTTLTVITDRVSHNPVTVGSDQTAGDVFNPVTIVPLPPITVGITKPGSEPTTRVIPLLPFPAVGDWPPRNGSPPSSPVPWFKRPTPTSPTGGPNPTSPTGGPNPTDTKTSSTDIIPITFPTKSRSFRIPTPKTTKPTYPPFTLTWTKSTPPPTTDISWFPWPPVTLNPTTTTTTSETPPFMTWPPNSIEFKPEEDGEEDDDLPCDMWFFFICIRWPKINIKWLKFPGPIPPGRYPWPPPPGVIKIPPGITIDIKPTPILTITRGKDNKWTTPDPQEEAKKCTRTSTIYDTMVSVTEVVYTTSRTTSTSTSTVLSTRLPRFGCDVTETGSSTTATSTAVCKTAAFTLPTGILTAPADERSSDAAVNWAASEVGQSNATTPPLRRRANPFEGWAMIIIPKKPFDTEALDGLLSGYKYKDDNGVEQQLKYTKIWAPHHHGFTGGWHLDTFLPCLHGELNSDAYKDKWRIAAPVAPDYKRDNPIEGPPPPVRPKLKNRRSPMTSSRKAATAQRLAKRTIDDSYSWEMSAVSVPGGMGWKTNPLFFDPETDLYNQMYHSSAGAGQDVYVYETHGVAWPNHAQFSHNKPDSLIMMADYGNRKGTVPVEDEGGHAANVVAKVISKELGTAKMAKVWSASDSFENMEWDWFRIMTFFRQMESFVNILENVAKEGKGDSSVINISSHVNVEPSAAKQQAEPQLKYQLQTLNIVMTDVLCELFSLGVVVVMSAGNKGKDVLPSETWPQFLADPLAVQEKWHLLAEVNDENKLRDLNSYAVLVGAVDMGGQDLRFSQDDCDFCVIWAPGRGWSISNWQDEISWEWIDERTGQPHVDEDFFDEVLEGTSFAAPMVAGLAAYFRGVAAADTGSLLSEKLKDPRNVVLLIDKLQRMMLDPEMPDNVKRHPMIWNGQVPKDTLASKPDLSCLHRADFQAMSVWQRGFCPEVEDTRFWDDYRWWSTEVGVGPRPGEPGSPVSPPSPTSPGSPTSPSGPTATGTGISFQPGEPGLQCSARTAPSLTLKQRAIGPFPMSGLGQCGVSCASDWYCDWWNDGLPPWFYDPLDPNNPNNPPPPLPTFTNPPTGPGGPPAGGWPHNPFPTPTTTTIPPPKPTETQPPPKPTDPPKPTEPPKPPPACIEVEVELTYALLNVGMTMILWRDGKKVCEDYGSCTPFDSFNMEKCFGSRSSDCGDGSIEWKDTFARFYPKRGDNSVSYEVVMEAKGFSGRICGEGCSISVWKGKRCYD